MYWLDCITEQKENFSILIFKYLSRDDPFITGNMPMWLTYRSVNIQSDMNDWQTDHHLCLVWFQSSPMVEQAFRLSCESAHVYKLCLSMQHLGTLRAGAETSIPCVWQWFFSQLNEMWKGQSVSQDRKLSNWQKPNMEIGATVVTAAGTERHSVRVPGGREVFSVPSNSGTPYQEKVTDEC